MLGLWLCLLFSGGLLIGQEFAPAAAEQFGTTESGMVAWTPAQDARLKCRYFTGLHVIEAQKGLLSGRAPGDASCPWLLRIGS